MSEDPLGAILAKLAAIDSRLETLEASHTRLIGQINEKLDDILDKLSDIRTDTDNTRGHLSFVMEDSLALGRRITKLEDEMRRRRSE